VIPCPRCGGDRVRADDAAYGEPEIMLAECQVCSCDFDVRITAEGVELAPVIYHGPGSGWDGPPHSHRDGVPCVLCDLADAADAAAGVDPGPVRIPWDGTPPPMVPAVYHPETGAWHHAAAPCGLCDRYRGELMRDPSPTRAHDDVERPFEDGGPDARLP
jgi:hypothetical protein